MIEQINFMRKSGVAAVLYGFLAISFCQAQEVATKPNIIFIYADDMGYGEIEALNPERSKVPTPALNRLSKEGMVFTDAHTSSSVCTPSRYALLTGRYNWRSRLQSGVVTGGNKPLIAKNRLTLPAILKSQGYSTSIVGKWHLEYEYEVPESLKNVSLTKETKQLLPAPYPIGTKIIGGPITRGFDSFYGFHHSRIMSSIIRNDAIVEEMQLTEVLPTLTSEVVKLIDAKAKEAKRGKPFFIYFPQNSPHTPIAPSKKWQGKTALGAYGDFVAETDGSVGEVLKALERNGLSDNTLVIFSADNGTSKAADIDFLESKGHFPSGDLRGSKADLWDGGHRVPFIVRWPGKISPGSKSNQLICLSDMMATFADLISTDIPENAGEDSMSFLQALYGKPIQNPRSSIVHHSLFGRFAVREGNWKLLLAPGSGGWTSPDDILATKENLPWTQLYDLSNDIGEQKNLNADETGKIKSLVDLLEKIVADGRSTPGEKQTNDVPIDIFKSSWNFNNKSQYQ